MPNTLADCIELLGDQRPHRLFVACSGGVDSMVLLYCLHRAKFDVCAIHVNYQLRGSHSDEDASLVQAFCEMRKIPFLSRRVSLSDQLKNGGNLQALAREIRYAWFDEILEEDTTHRIVLGHHADDQVETFLMHLGRKSGIMGLACMPAERGNILRPFLQLRKTSLLEYARKHHIPWREDASNSTNIYRRNLLRNRLIPEMRTIVPQIDDAVLLLVSTFQRTQDELQSKMEALKDRIEGSGSIPISCYAALNRWEKVELLRQMKLSATYMSRIEELINGKTGKKIPLPLANFESIVRERDALKFMRIEVLSFELIVEEAVILPDSLKKRSSFLIRFQRKNSF